MWDVDEAIDVDVSDIFDRVVGSRRGKVSGLERRWAARAAQPSGGWLGRRWAGAVRVGCLLCVSSGVSRL